MKIYCDGSSLGNPGPSGCAFVVVSGNTELHRESHNLGTGTNNVAELTAFILSVKWIQENAPGQKFTVFSDSQYVIKGTTEWMKGWIAKDWKGVKNTDVWKIVEKETKHLDFEMVWVKAHNGDYWNEIADDLAKEAASKS